MPRQSRPERRPLNEGRDPLDRYCRACGALPGQPCVVRGAPSPENVRTHADERAWKLARAQEIQGIVAAYVDGDTPIDDSRVRRLLQQVNRTLIHESR